MSHPFHPFWFTHPNKNLVNSTDKLNEMIPDLNVVYHKIQSISTSVMKRYLKYMTGAACQLWEIRNVFIMVLSNYFYFLWIWKWHNVLSVKWQFFYFIQRIAEHMIYLAISIIWQNISGYLALNEVSGFIQLYRNQQNLPRQVQINLQCVPVAFWGHIHKSNEKVLIYHSV
jgi:hypothetical protein